MLSSSTELQIVFRFAPEWEGLTENWQAEKNLCATELLNRVGAKALFRKASHLEAEQQAFVRLLRDYYYQPLLQKMVGSSQNMRRFLSQRFVSSEEQRNQSISFSVDLAQKLEGVLTKQLQTKSDDGFKVLLPAYIQRSVHNAVVDYIRQETSWEKSTLQDMFLDPEQEDPRTRVADDSTYTPEQQVLNSEQVGQLNELRGHLKAMLQDKDIAHEPLIVLDCLFGLGLTASSKVGQELTMRECCEVLNIQAETMARRIARCQVLMDKGLDMVRQRIYKQLPGLVDAWQRGVNLNTASRRELTQQLGMTEGEIDRLIKGRQFSNLDEVVKAGVIKPNRLPEISHRGACAAFVPVDINTATARDITDVLGLHKDLSQKIVGERPFRDLNEILEKGLLSRKDIEDLSRRGAVVRVSHADTKRLDLNRASEEEICALAIEPELVRLILRGRPFTTWAELEEQLGPDCPQWNLIRQKFFLGLISS